MNRTTKKSMVISVMIIAFALFMISALLSSCEKYESSPVIAIDTTKCDTTNVKYSEFVQPLIEAKCVSCHNSGTSLGGVNLEGYDNVHSAAASGKLANSLSGSMRTYVRDDCDYAKVIAWINNSAPKN